MITKRTVLELSPRTRIAGPRSWLLALCLGLLACGGGSGPDGPVDPGLSAAFQSSGTAAAPDLVRLVGSTADGDLTTLDVAISGPTASADIYSFAFDLVLSDSSVARYEGGSAAAGGALDVESGQGLSVLAAQQGDRVVVGVSKTGGGAGNGIASGEEVIVSLVFRVLRSGETAIRIEGPPTEPPVALDSGGETLISVQFDAAEGRIQAN